MSNMNEAKTLQDIITATRASIDDASPREWTAAATINYNSQSPVTEAKQFDEIDKPSHYNQGKYETIDVIVDTLGKFDAINYCHGNVLKYTIRMWHKDSPDKNAKKAQWYLNKMIQLLEETKGVNW